MVNNLLVSLTRNLIFSARNGKRIKTFEWLVVSAIVQISNLIRLTLCVFDLDKYY